MKVCVLGASGCIGMEVVASLLGRGYDQDRKDIHVVGVVRNGSKLSAGMERRGLLPPANKRLKIREGDVFATGEGFLEDVMKGCDVVLNCASPALSWNPFSTVNRNWGSPVSDLTCKIISVASNNAPNTTQSSTNGPRIIAFSGPEYFDEYDPRENISSLFRCASWLSQWLYPALRDNAVEVRSLLNSGYPRWTVFRCGSTRPNEGSTKTGDATKIGSDLHHDGSDYGQDRGYSLRAADLGAFVADSIVHGKHEIKEMPFVWNTRL